MARVVDPRLNTAERRRLNTQVRARHQPCPMCGHPIDQTLDRQTHPLGSTIDEWVPRHPCTKAKCCSPANATLQPGDPYNPADCNEMHRVCGTVKHNHWPITDEMRNRCRTLVERHLGQPTVTRCW